MIFPRRADFNMYFCLVRHPRGYSVFWEMVFCVDTETFLYDKHRVLLFCVMDMGMNLPFPESL